MNIDHLQFINNVLFKDFDFRQKQTNQLMIGLSYSFRITMDEHFIIWKISEYILTKSTNNKEILIIYRKLMIYLYCCIASYDINFSLLQNNINKFNKFHLFFGKNISQLCSIILISKGLDIVNDTFNDYKKKIQIISLFEKELEDIRKNNLLLQLETINSKLIKKEYKKGHFIFFRLSILIVNYLLNNKINKDNEKSILKLYRFSFPNYNES